jgi:uncharacterized protein (TIGR00661 family)
VKHVLVSPLSWGLGHATRDLPIIRYVLARGHHVTILACGRALSLLKQEVPQCDFVELEDYPTPYSHTRYFVPKFLAMAPVMWAAVIREGLRVRGRILRERPVDLILSDNRFNVRSPDVPSYIISHQLRFMTPHALRAFEFVTEYFNHFYLKDFDRVIVPDFADPDQNLSGRLSHRTRWLRPEQIYYAGVLSSTARMDVPEDVDLFFSISGPEPQRTQLEEIVLAHVKDLDARRIVVTLGKPEVKEVRQLDDRITVYGFLDRAGQQEMLNRARLVVCRSGYTTVMELAELGKKALFIPTPGQTEQEYLARYYEERGFFHSVSQYELDLPRDIARAREMAGVPLRADTRAGVERLYADLFAPVLDA